MSVPGHERHADLSPRQRHLCIPLLGQEHHRQPGELAPLNSPTTIDLAAIVDDAINGEGFSAETVQALHNLFEELSLRKGTTGSLLARHLNFVREAALQFRAARLGSKSGESKNAKSRNSIDMSVSIDVDGGVTVFLMLSSDADSLRQNRRDIASNRPSQRIVRLGPFFSRPAPGNF